MLYKKGIISQIKAKIVGSATLKRKNKKCQLISPPNHHHNGLHQGKDSENDVVDLVNKINAHTVANQPKDVPGQAKPKVSGLLAAKLQCDEWGLKNGRLASTDPSSQKTLSSQKQARRIRRATPPRYESVNDAVKQHPSYKPPTEKRSTSMKERHAALATAMKDHTTYFTSLYPIYTIPEDDEMEH